MEDHSLTASDVMGIDVNRFKGEVDEELMCPICSGVLENPLQVGMAVVGCDFTKFCCSS